MVDLSLTEQEERDYERWKRSFGSPEALSLAVYRNTADAWYYGGPQEARYVKKGASEEAIRTYYEDICLYRRKGIHVY